MSHITAITSGKGGVGKTCIAANLAAVLARRGQRVLVLDADLGLANLDVVLGLAASVTLHDVFTGQATLEQATVAAPGGFSVLLAGSGMVEYSRMTPELRDKLPQVLAEVGPQYDHVLLDTGAGISDVVLYTVSLADDVIVVATPEPTSLTDAYATIKVLATTQGRREIQVLVNQVRQRGEGRAVWQQIQGVVDRYLNAALEGGKLTLKLAGEVPADSAVRDSVRRRELLVEKMPGAPAAVAVAAAAGQFALA